jgi:hypothetical protein
VRTREFIFLVKCLWKDVPVDSICSTYGEREDCTPCSSVTVTSRTLEIDLKVHAF